MAKPDTIKTEQKLSELETETLDALVGDDEEEDLDANTYSGISKIQQEQSRAQAAMKPGLVNLHPDAPKTTYINGEVPKMAGGPWATGDQFGKESSLGFDINGPDPSGSQRFRGPG